MNQVVVKILHGSKLYGTETPSSDTDLKSVFLPSIQDLILSRAAHTGYTEKTPENEDREIFSLQQFCKLAKQGQSVAIEMLFAPPANVLESSETWEKLVARRFEFIKGNLRPFVGFAKSQALKNSGRAKRLGELKEFENYLIECSKRNFTTDNIKLGYVLPHIDFKKFSFIQLNNGNQTVLVCNRQLQYNADLHWCISQVQNWINNYGSRINETTKTGKDWKALSHALRVAYEVEEIYLTNNLILPLSRADFLRAVKLGEVKEEIFEEEYEKVLDKIEGICKNRGEIKQDWLWLDEIILKAYNQN